MWPVRYPTVELPVGFMLLEEIHTVMVRCEWCGREKVYMANHVAPDALQAEAYMHRVDCHLPRGDQQ